MTPAEFLRELQSRGFRVWAEGDRVRCSAPLGAVTAEVKAELRARKDEVLTFLRTAESLAGQQRALVPLQPHGHRTPIFAVPGHNGNVFSFRTFSEVLGDDQPFYGLQPPGVDGKEAPLERIEEIAAYFAKEIIEFGLSGPYAIAGHCSGGTIAFELARQLRERSLELSMVALFGSSYPTWWRRGHVLRRKGEYYSGRVAVHARAMRALPVRERLAYLPKRLRHLAARRSGLNGDESQDAPTLGPAQLYQGGVSMATKAGLIHHIPRRYPGHVDLFLPNPAARGRGAEMLRWRSLADSAEVHVGPGGCSTDTMLQEPWAHTTAELFKRARDSRQRESFTGGGWAL